MPEPVEVVVTEFTGATGAKSRPAVVVSSKLYHDTRPDLVLAALTTNLVAATTQTDYVLQDRSDAGLYQPSALRAYLGMYSPARIHRIAHLSKRDWDAVQRCLALAISVQQPPAS